MNESGRGTANGPAVLPASEWVLLPTDEGETEVWLLAGQARVGIMLDDVFVDDLRRFVNGEIGSTDMGEYRLEDLNDVLYLTLRDEKGHLEIEIGINDGFLNAVQTMVGRRRAATARLYLSRALILLVTLAVIAGVCVAAPHVIA